jgi:hypothetical protein
MEPRREELRRKEPKTPRPRPEQKRKRFHLIKVEARIAPSNGGTVLCTRACTL